MRIATIVSTSSGIMLAISSEVDTVNWLRPKKGRSLVKATIVSSFCLWLCDLDFSDGIFVKGFVTLQPR